MNKSKILSLSFGKNVAKIRKAQGLTQEEFGKKIRLSKRAVCYYEKKSHDLPSADLIVKMCAVLNVSFEKVLNWQIPKEFSEHQKLWKKLRRVETLPPTDQEAILNMVNHFLKRKAV